MEKWKNCHLGTIFVDFPPTYAKDSGYIIVDDRIGDDNKSLTPSKTSMKLDKMFSKICFFVALLKIKIDHEWQVSFHVLSPARIVDKLPDLGESQAELFFLLSKCMMDDGYLI